MVCDFLVYTYLEIKHKEGIAYIELDYKQEWYCDCLEPNIDSDDEEENYIRKCDEYYKSFLNPSINPIMIYNEGRFLRHSYVEKYLNLIYEKVHEIKYWRDSGTLLSIDDIQQIRKIEIREKT